MPATGENWKRLQAKLAADSGSLPVLGVRKRKRSKVTAAPSNASLPQDAAPEATVSDDAPVQKRANTDKIGRYVAIDCEMVGVGLEGKESVLARVSLVNYHGAVVMDEIVAPQERVVDFRTWVSGISPGMLNAAKPFAEVQKRVADVLDDRILVGHAVHHDLKALLLSHPRHLIRDTSLLKSYRAYAKGKTPSLKKLAAAVLGREIQTGQHSSVEDARVCMELFKRRKDEFEKRRGRDEPGRRRVEKKKARALADK